MSRFRFRLFLATGLLVLGTAAHLPAQQSKNHYKLSTDAAAAAPSATLPVIIQYRTDPGSEQSASLSAVGGTLRGQLHSIHAFTAKITQNQLEQLAEDPNVTYVSVDRPLAARDAFSITAADYSTEPINAPAVWNKGYVGTNIGVAVIDSGITPVADLSIDPVNFLPALPGQLPPPVPPPSLLLGPQPAQVAPGATGRIVYSQNFVPGQNDALDHYGHGTHVAGLIGGNGAQSYGPPYYRTFFGAAPNVNFINLRVLDQNGAGTDSSVIAAIEQAVALKNTYNIRVINLSLGRPIYESYTLDPLCQAVEQAWKAGIVVVVAAGNDGRDLNLNSEGYGTINAPGNDPYVLTVGAMNTVTTPQINDDVIASYSSKGPSFVDYVTKPDIVAPGNLVVSLEFNNDPLAVNNPSFVTLNSFYHNGNNNKPSTVYFPLSGTSMATGVTSGAIADLLQANSSLTPDQVKALLMLNANRSYFPQTSSVTDSGVTFNANYDVFTIGAGYLDIAATINAALVNNGSVPAGTAMSPIASYDPTTGDTTLVTDQTALWGKTSMYGASSVYGSNAFVPTDDGSTALWGETALWGKSDPNAFTALWGSTALWGKGTPDAATALWGKSSTQAATALWGKTTTTTNGVPLE